MINRAFGYMGGIPQLPYVDPLLINAGQNVMNNPVDTKPVEKVPDRTEEGKSSQPSNTVVNRDSKRPNKPNQSSDNNNNNNSNNNRGGNKRTSSENSKPNSKGGNSSKDKNENKKDNDSSNRPSIEINVANFPPLSQVEDVPIPTPGYKDAFLKYSIDDVIHILKTVKEASLPASFDATGHPLALQSTPNLDLLKRQRTFTIDETREQLIQGRPVQREAVIPGAVDYRSLMYGDDSSTFISAPSSSNINNDTTSINSLPEKISKPKVEVETATTSTSTTSVTAQTTEVTTAPVRTSTAKSNQGSQTIEDNKNSETTPIQSESPKAIVSASTW